MYTYLAILFSISFSAAAVHSPASPAVETRSIDKIYQAALKENGTLRVAWGGDIESSGLGIINTFEARFPGIKLDLNVDLSKYSDCIINRAYEETRGADNAVDVAVLQSLHDFPIWKAQNRLLPYKVSQWDDIYPAFVDDEGCYIGLYIFKFGPIVYIPSRLDGLALPTTYPDFVKPEWNGKITLTYPNDDDAILYLFTLITQKYGWEFIQTLNNNNVKWVRGTASPSLVISSNATNNPYRISFASSSAFAPQTVSVLPDDVYMAWPQTGAIFAETKVPESAKLFMNFLMDDQWQKIIGSNGFATRRTFDTSGVFNSPHMDPLGYARFMSNRELVEDWRLQFESILGTPQGQNPVNVTY